MLERLDGGLESPGLGPKIPSTSALQLILTFSIQLRVPLGALPHLCKQATPPWQVLGGGGQLPASCCAL